MKRLVNALKLLKLGDAAVRRNPWFYAHAQNALELLDKADLQTRREWTRARLEEVLWSARRSQYGRQVRGTKDLHSWPLLTKASAQAAPRSFCASSRLLTVSASTGG